MKKIYALFFVIQVSMSWAQTAITLNNSNMPGANDTMRYTNVQPASIGNYTQTGANFNWDFSNVVSTTSARRDFKSALNTPYAFYFLSLGEYGEKIADTLVGGTGTITITNYYNFYKKQTTPANAFVADGVGMSISGLPVASYYSDKDELYMFPMTYPKYDSTSFKFSTLTTTLLPIKYTKAGYRVTKVDGWGSIKTPYGTDNCLRLVTTQYSIDTISVNLPIPGLPPIKFGTPNNQRSYQWISSSSKIPYMEVSGSLLNNNFTVTQIRYRGYNTKSPPPPPPNLVGIDAINDISALESYPNPVRDKMWLNGQVPMPSKIEFFDLNGRLVSTQNIEQMGQVSYVETAALNVGIYVAKINLPSQNIIFKFIKE
ncbi:MAG: T9SS type A sorting domain-containing protein [Bacteroidota bacterium]